MNRLTCVHLFLLCSVIESYSKALLHEEKKCRYVSKQVALMFRIMETEASSSFGNANNSANTPSNNSITTSMNISNAPSASNNSIVGPNSVSGGALPLIDATGCPSPLASGPSSSVLSNGMRSGAGELSSFSTDSNNGGGPSMNSIESNIVNDAKNATLRIMERILQDSSLANELRNIYHGLTGKLNAQSVFVHCVISILTLANTEPVRYFFPFFHGIP